MTRNEANKIIHERIMGKCAHEWQKTDTYGVLSCMKCNEYNGIISNKVLPGYCEDANDALEVFNKAEMLQLIRRPDGSWYAQYPGTMYIITVIATTAPLAICTAALKMLGITEEIEG